MTFFNNLNIRTKLGASIFAVFGVVFVLLLTVFLLEFNGLLDREESGRNTALHNSFLTALQGQARTATDMANLLAQSGDEVAAMAEKDRKYLADNYIETCNNLKKIMASASCIFMVPTILPSCGHTVPAISMMT